MAITGFELESEVAPAGVDPENRQFKGLFKDLLKGLF
jgi:hypothetical protein